ncbi:hypothetical protein B0T17DRAFT_490535 [Bombardia bombarda]|uniref:Cupin type-2 domain-containing protein n=1 Tax=Bombardia bombarda TaxID=252184 RepID=A0AA39X9X2_9PEZI|nr:hypothetical protein B0T17DRAFT_490535 [Bombardia bombarda]
MDDNENKNSKASLPPPPPPPPTSSLRPLNRFITTHTPSGLAVFEPSLPETPTAKIIENGDGFTLSYATSQYPADFTTDLATYRSFLTEKPPGVVVPGGTVLRVVDIRPGGESPMHRTVSLDYGVVLDGEIELELDSGETRVMRAGDHAVQRGTMHRWRNTSGEGKWARMLFVLTEARPVVVEETGRY